jgi:hypothetical protein
MIVSYHESIVFAVAATLKCSDENKVLEYYIDKISFSSYSIYYIEHKIGPLNEFSCGAVTGANDYDRFVAKAVTIKYDNISEELRESEMRKLKKYFKETTFTSANCIMKRFEDDPTAFLSKNTLNYFLTEAIKSLEIQRNTVKKVEADIDQECVKEKLNLPENGAKAFTKAEATLIIASAKIKCIKVDSTTFLDDFLKYAVPKTHIKQSDVTCAKYYLQKVEPTSKLAKLPRSDRDYEEYCTRSFLQTLQIYPDYGLDRYIGKEAILNESTCGLLTEQDVYINKHKTILLAFEMDEELKKSEGSALFAEVTDKLQKISDCFFERVK